VVDAALQRIADVGLILTPAATSLDVVSHGSAPILPPEPRMTSGHSPSCAAWAPSNPGPLAVLEFDVSIPYLAEASYLAVYITR